MLAVIVVKRWGFGVFPLWEYAEAREYMENSERIKTGHAENMKTFRLDVPAEETLAGELPGTVLLIIGESANREHMKAFTPGYPAETTPWQSDMAARGELFLFPHAYSNFAITWQSLSMALTSRNQYNGKSEAESLTVVGAANLAGYRTYFITNQKERENEIVEVMSAAATGAKELETVGGDDMRMRDALRELPKEENQFVILHMKGSHARYESRLPEGFPLLKTEGISDKVNAYDSTLLYEDTVLREIYEYARDNMNLRAMIYCSDHSEDMEYSHNGSRATWSMLHIPFWIYLSPAYREKYPETAATLRAHGRSVFTNDLLFDAVCGILRAPNPAWEARHDITGAGYALTAENALTMHGQWNIGDDPELAGRIE